MFFKSGKLSLLVISVLSQYVQKQNKNNKSEEKASASKLAFYVAWRQIESQSRAGHLFLCLSFVQELHVSKLDYTEVSVLG